MYLAGGGSVHKGLDRVIEAFSARPDLKLYVCSPFRYEQDFCEVYKHELFRTPNIIPIGFLKLGIPSGSSGWLRYAPLAFSHLARRVCRVPFSLLCPRA